MVTNWHEASESPKYDKLCVIRIANDHSKIDYQIARFRKLWRYRNDKTVTEQSLRGGRIIESPYRTELALRRYFLAHRDSYS